MHALLWFAEAPTAPLPASALFGARHIRTRLTLLARESPMTTVQLARAVSACAATLIVASAAAVVAFPIERHVLDRWAPAGSPPVLDRALKPAPWARLLGLPSSRSGKSQAAEVKDRGIVPPSVVSETKPSYTQAAMDAKIEGDVVMSTVVTPEGQPSETRVTKSLDAKYGLDQAAVTALAQWRFSPGTRDGTPVPVRVDVMMRFTLK
jgi:TonB family protein